MKVATFIQAFYTITKQELFAFMRDYLMEKQGMSRDEAYGFMVRYSKASKKRIKDNAEGPQK